MHTIRRGSVLMLALVASSLAVYEQGIQDGGTGDGYELEKTLEEDPVLDIEGNVFDQRRIKKTLTVNNGDSWGKWGAASYCPPGSFASGYQMKIERKQGSGDDTALNAIKIICKNSHGTINHYSSSTVGHWGTWGEETFCRGHGRGRYPDYMTAFSLQVEKPQGVNHDDTAANFVKFMCRGLTQTNNHEYELVKSPGRGYWGTWGAWSDSCDEGTAICGIATRVEKKHWWHAFKDDTALNNVKFFCCKD